MFSLHLPQMVSSFFQVFQNIGKSGNKPLSAAVHASVKVFHKSAPLIKGASKKSIAAAVIVLGLVTTAAIISAIFAAIWFIAKKDNDKSQIEKEISEKYKTQEFVEKELVLPEDNRIEAKEPAREGIDFNLNCEITDMSSVLPTVTIKEVNIKQKKNIHKNFVVKQTSLNRNRVLPPIPYNTDHSVWNEAQKSKIEVILKKPVDRSVVNIPILGQPSIPARNIESFSNSRQQMMDFNSLIRNAKRPIPGRRLPTKQPRKM